MLKCLSPVFFKEVVIFKIKTIKKAGKVLVSKAEVFDIYMGEHVASDDFECIWEMPTKRTICNTKRVDCTERLFEINKQKYFGKMPEKTH